MLPVTVRVNDSTGLLSLYGALAKVWLQRGPTETGLFTDITSKTLVAGDDTYVFAISDPVSTDWYRSYITTSANASPSNFSEAFQEQPAPVVSPAQVNAMVETGMSDEDLAEVISRAEAMLAAEIGPLTGPRTETFTILSGETRRALRLRRATRSVVVTTDNTTTTDFRLAIDGRTITPLAVDGWSRGYWPGVVEVTYTPNDRELVAAAVIDLCRSLTTESTFQSETIGDYSYTRGPSRTSVFRIARIYGLLSPLEPGSVRLSRGRYPGWVGTERPT